MNDKETLDRVLKHIHQTCLIAIDKTIYVIKQSPKSYATAGAKLVNLGNRMVIYAEMVGMTLPVEQRATRPPPPAYKINRGR